MKADKKGTKEDKKKLSATAKYALTSERTSLGEGREGVTVTEEGDWLKFSLQGICYALLMITDHELVLRFRKANKLDDLEKKLIYYKETSVKGWLEWRTPISRDPRPSLEAGLGNMTGQIKYEICQGEHVEITPEDLEKIKSPVQEKADQSATELAFNQISRSVSSFGGPYIVIPATVADKWLGSDNIDAYELVCKGPETGHITPVAGQHALILGTPDNLHFMPLSNSSGLFIRVISSDANNDQELQDLLKVLPKKGWELVKDKFEIKGPLLAFDSALPGEDVLNDALSVNLTPGSYQVSTTTFHTDNETEFLLTRLDLVKN
ncbi:MAG: Imm21 family immunity protein [Daejeonella sp.]